MSIQTKFSFNTLRPVAASVLSASLLALGSVNAIAAGQSAAQSDGAPMQAQASAGTDRQAKQEQGVSKRTSTQDQPQAPQFDQVDTNQDNQVVWTEIYAIYDDELADAGWNQESVYGSYDENRDNSLDEQEYVLFLTGLVGVPAIQQNVEKQYHQANQQEREGAAEQARQQQAANDQNAERDVANTSPQDDRQEQQSNRNEQARNDDEVISVVSVTTVTAVPDIEGREVINLHGESIGEVEEVLTNADGSVSDVVVGVGGFWDIGDKDVKVDASELRLSGDYIVWDTVLEEDQLDDLPEYQGNEVSAAY